MIEKQIYKEAMEKIAARAWKKHLGSLSEGGVNRLVNSGVLNYNKELKGLRGGTHAINARYGVKELRNPNKAAAGYIQQLRSNNPQLGSGLDNYVGAIKNQIKELGPHSAFNFSGTPNKALNGKKTYTYVQKNAYNKDIADNPQFKAFYGEDTFKRIPRRDRDGRKWVQAILERHEADEARVAGKMKKKNIYRNPYNNQEMAKTQYFSHVSPEVLQRESANVALAPKSAKNVMTNMRNVSMENKDLANRNGGFPYASSAVYNKKATRKAEKSIVNQLNNQLKQVDENSIKINI